ncbi:phage tail domain-containing protein [Streptomyces sp. 769]|uniref:phage tail domain-containing protein n=1 Tax=Streptomyces sp. 769 TaxID=1262452 RepID=UPI00057F2F6A|nr:phage tail domain-containing protein [Streptomyces sp. 769]AJC54003.1 hypothetical protein GZL_01403 [Streptomyces sp. 769]
MPIPATYDYFPDHGGSGKEKYQPVLWPYTFVTWTGSDGKTIPLTGDIQCQSSPVGIGILRGPQALDMPTYDLKSDALPNLAGSLFKSVRATSRDITIPIRIQALDRKSLIEMKQYLFHSLNPYRGPGKITVTEGDGSPRHLECYYVDGAQGAEGEDQAGFVFIQYALVFRAMAPYWSSNRHEQFDWHIASQHDKPFFSDQFLPLQVGSSGFTPGTPVTVTNDSSLECWPVWQVSGSITALSLTNETTHETTGETIRESFAFLDDFTINKGQTATIDTSPSIKSVVLNDGGPEQNLWPKVKTASSMWSLKPGDNTITINGAKPDEFTFVRLTFIPRYLSYSGG